MQPTVKVVQTDVEPQTWRGSGLSRSAEEDRLGDMSFCFGVRACSCLTIECESGCISVLCRACRRDIGSQQRSDGPRESMAFQTVDPVKSFLQGCFICVLHM